MMLVLSQLWTTKVNLPSIDVGAADRGLPRRCPKQNIVEELMVACQQQLVTKQW